MSADRILAKRARERASLAASTAGRAAQRCIDRHNTVTEYDEVDTLNAQIAELDEESDEDSAKEYAIIQARFKAIAAEYKAKATEQANAELTFACAICFENKQMDTLRILPCGHGFCTDCVNAHMAAAVDDDDRPVCPNCRAVITSVITPRF
jgi:rubrerythrin